MKSRILAVLFAAMLVAGTLVGCGSKAAEDAETKTEDTKEDTNDAEDDKDTSENGNGRRSRGSWIYRCF